MDKALISALLTGSFASALTALIGGIFQRSSKSVDGSIANKNFQLAATDQSFKQMQVILDETKADRDKWKDSYDFLVLDAAKLAVITAEKYKKYDEQIAQIQEANVFLILAALRNNNLEDLHDIPMTVEMRRLYDMAVRNARPAGQLLDKQLSVTARVSPELGKTSSESGNTSHIATNLKSETITPDVDWNNT